MKTFNIHTTQATRKFSLKAMTLLTGLFLSGIFMTSTASADEVTYTVQAGDTLSDISNKFYHDQDHIQSIATDNHINNVSLIFVGQTLKFNTDTKVAPTVIKQNTAPAAPATPVTPAVPVAATTTIATNNGFTANSAKEAIAMTESGGSYTAQNGRYYGRYQLTNSYLGGDYSPENQERVADAYVAGRYGSWEAAWQFHLANGWY